MNRRLRDPYATKGSAPGKVPVVHGGVRGALGCTQPEPPTRLAACYIIYLKVISCNRKYYKFDIISLLLK